MQNNPFQFGQPNQQIKTPEQYMRDYNSLMYGNPMMPQPVPVPVSGVFHYVKSFSEVEQSQVPMNGTPEIFISPESHMLWVKQLRNGQAYSSAYTYSQSDVQGEPPKKPSEMTMEDLAKMLIATNKRLDSIEKGTVKAEFVPNKPEQAESVRGNPFMEDTGK